MRTGAEGTPTLFGFDDRLIAAPEEILLPDQLHEPPALQHFPDGIRNAREHQGAALPLQAFVQVVDGLQACRIDQRYAAHGEYQRMCLIEAREGLIELPDRRKEKRAGKEGHPHVPAFAGRLDPLLPEFFSIDVLHTDLDACDPVQKYRPGQERADQDGLRQIQDHGCQHRHAERDHVSLEEAREHETDRSPLDHARRGDHQHAGKRRQRDARHHRRQEEHRE
jgi:hypothetical protein